MAQHQSLHFRAGGVQIAPCCVNSVRQLCDPTDRTGQWSVNGQSVSLLCDPTDRTGQWSVNGQSDSTVTLQIVQVSGV